MNLRWGQLWLLSLWILLSFLLELANLLGRQWLLVLSYFLQLLLCIIGVFGVHQRRKSLIGVHLIGCLLGIAFNGLLIVWWLGYLGDPSRPILSLGLQFSYSFFLRYTPWCPFVYDHELGYSIQKECWLPYQYIETSIAILNIALAFLSFIFSIVNMCSKTKAPPPPIPALRHSKTSHHTSSFPKRGVNFSSSHGGYANGVYEDDRMRPSTGMESIYGVREGSRTLSTTETELSNGDKKLYAELNKGGRNRIDDRRGGGETIRGPSQRRFQRGPINDHRRSDRYSSNHNSTSEQLNTSMNVSREQREMKTTSLISFDPKSPTPIQVHEMEGSQSEEETQSDNQSIDDYVVRGPSRSEILRASQRIWNNDDVPTTSSANIHNHASSHNDPPMGYGRYGSSSIDSAYCGSAQRGWSTTKELPSSSSQWNSNGGLPLSTEPYPNRDTRPTSFHIRPEGGSLVGGHYHSIEEIQLVQSGGGHARISGDALLV